MSRSFVVLIVATVVGFSPSAEAGELHDNVAQLIEGHKRLEASRADLEAAKQRAKTSFGAWYPTLDATTSYGYETQRKGQGTADTSMPPRAVELSLSQLVYDFGATNAAVDRSELEVTQAAHTLASTRQTLILDGINAHLGVIRQRKLLSFNEGSIANVKRQMQLEDARVQRGSGLATDVLQAKSQLAGLEATQTRIKGALLNAINRYRALYGKEPTPGKEGRKVKLPKLPLDLLPATVDEAIAIATEENPRLKSTYLGTLVAQKTITETRANEFYPAINASAEQNYKHDEGGTIGGKQESMVKIEMTYSLNLGLTGINTLKATKLTHHASVNRFKEDRDFLEERVRNAWNDLKTAQTRFEQLNNQTNIASEFLELARRERQLGNRSLIDVLSGETALINATSDAASAEVDVAQSVYRLLAAMGRLNLSAIEG